MKIYRNKHDSRITAEQSYEWFETYNILNEKRLIILSNVPEAQIENNGSWILEEEHEKIYSHEELKDAALQILSKIMFYGGWEVETPNERTLTGIMHYLGYWPWEDEDQMIENTDEHEVLHKRWRYFDWKRAENLKVPKYEGKV